MNAYPHSRVYDVSVRYVLIRDRAVVRGAQRVEVDRVPRGPCARIVVGIAPGTDVRSTGAPTGRVRPRGDGDRGRRGDGLSDRVQSPRFQFDMGRPQLLDIGQLAATACAQWCV